MKQFKLSFEDKQGNELTVRVVDAYGQRDADAIAEIHFATSNINDLFIIRATEI
jgi:FKBP-type peptidyl-prolyl cis-trans isomerase 2